MNIIIKECLQKIYVSCICCRTNSHISPEIRFLPNVEKFRQPLVDFDERYFPFQNELFLQKIEQA